MTRRAKRWAAIAWAVLVVAGGGSTLWLEGATPDGSVSRSETEPAPGRAPTGDDDCAPPPGIAEEDADGAFSWSCLEPVGPPPEVEGPPADYGHAPAPDPFPDVPRPGDDEPCPGDDPDDESIVLCVYASGE